MVICLSSWPRDDLTVPRYVLHFICYIFYKYVVFEWGEIISMIFPIIYEISRRPIFFLILLIEVKTKPIQNWYALLWRHNAPLYYYNIQYAFVKRFKQMVISQILDRLTLEAQTLLMGSGEYFYE